MHICVNPASISMRDPESFSDFFISFDVVFGGTAGRSDDSFSIVVHLVSRFFFPVAFIEKPVAIDAVASFPALACDMPAKSFEYFFSLNAVARQFGKLIARIVFMDPAFGGIHRFE